MVLGFADQGQQLNPAKLDSLLNGPVAKKTSWLEGTGRHAYTEVAAQLNAGAGRAAGPRTGHFTELSRAGADSLAALNEVVVPICC